MVLNGQIGELTKTRKRVRLQHIHFNLNESITERPQIEEQFLFPKHSISQALVQKTSMDNMEDRPRQLHGTLTTGNTGTDHSNNKQERSYAGNTSRKLLEKKRQKECRLIPGGAKRRSLIKWYGNEQSNKDNGRGQKQNARSVAEAEGGKGAAACIEQPPRKREKNRNPGLKLG